MNIEIDISKLNLLLETAKSKYQWNRGRRLLHLKTVENFIYHLPKIKDRSRKEFAYIALSEYLSFLNRLDESYVINAELGNELFSRHLNQLTNYYDYRLGFSPFIHKYYLLTFLFITEAIVYLFNAAFLVHLLLVIACILYAMFQMKKVYQKKVYGIFY